MEPKEFAKTGKVILFGFVFFSLIVIWLVNVYLSEKKNNPQNEIDTQMSKAILLDTYYTNQILDKMYDDLLYQKEWLKNTLQPEYYTNDISIMNDSIYLSKENVSILDEQKIKDTNIVGNIILQGDWANTKPEIKEEINHMTSFFKLEHALQQQRDFEMNSIYYSKNKYVTYYPYMAVGQRPVDYNQTFENLDNLISRINKLEHEDSNFNPEKGWDRLAVDNTSANNLSLTTALPVIINSEVTGILTGSISGDSISEVLNKDLKNTDVFIVDSNNAILYSSNKDYPNLSDISNVFSEHYKIKYYQNKFPTQLEVRREKDYTLYISKLSKENWYIIYVADQMKGIAVLKIVGLNLLMLCILIGTVYFSNKSANKKKDDIESIIKNSKNDSMTELLNHKYILDALKKIMRNRSIRQLAIMMLDLDDFKLINDTHGHAIGDEVIHNCALVLKDFFNDQNGVTGRYGGEEFLLISLRTTREEANAQAEQIRVAINELIYEKMGLNVTASIGLYHIVKPVNVTIMELVKEADKNLYKAKKSGKNQVQSSDNSL